MRNTFGKLCVITATIVLLFSAGFFTVSLILKDGESLTEDELKDYVRSHMARHKVPRYVQFADAFPMNAAGKILKYKMREEAAALFGTK